MTTQPPETPEPPTEPVARRRHIVRLAMFAAFLLVLFYLVAVQRVVNVDEVRALVRATGPFAPLTYAVLSALLGAIFVPGPILAAGSGFLFGPILGTFVTLAATVGTAAVASLAGRRAGRQGRWRPVPPSRRRMLPPRAACRRGSRGACYPVRL